MNDHFVELTDEEILNPEPNSFEAALLLATCFTLFEKNRGQLEVGGDATRAALLHSVPNRIRAMWVARGVRAQGSAYAVPRGERYLNAIGNELENSPDPILVRQSIAELIVVPIFKRYMLALLIYLARVSGDIDDSERQFLTELAQQWEMHDLNDDDFSGEAPWVKDINEQFGLEKAFGQANLERKITEGPKGLVTKGEGCFIATAVMKDPTHPILSDLRSFRDETLSSSRAGRKFIAWYYNHGPSLAKKIGASPTKCGLFKYLLIYPIVIALRLTLLSKRK